MNCKSCQTTIDDGIKFCISCGSPVPSDHLSEDLSESVVNTEIAERENIKSEPALDNTSALKTEPAFNEPKPSQPKVNGSNTEVGSRSFIATWVLATFFGFLGADRFYLGHVGTGVVKLVGFGWFGVWWLVDLMRINKGAQRDSSGKQLSGSDEFIGKARVISAVLIPIVLIMNLFVLIAVVAGLLAPTET